MKNRRNFRFHCFLVKPLGFEKRSFQGTVLVKISTVCIPRMKLCAPSGKRKFILRIHAARCLLRNWITLLLLRLHVKKSTCNYSLQHILPERINSSKICDICPGYHELWTVGQKNIFVD